MGDVLNLSLVSTMPVMVSQIAAMFLMMAVGAACYKCGLITRDGSMALTNLACYVSTPAVIVRALAVPFGSDVFVFILKVAAASCTIMIGVIIVTRAVYGTGSRVAQLGIIISNMGFVGIPLVENVVGSDYVVYISAVMATQIVFIWTYCIWLYTQDVSEVSFKKIATNPVMVAVVVGFVMFIFSCEPKGTVKSFIDGMANLNTGLGMLIVGVFLAQSDLRALVRTRSIYKASALRLIATTALSGLIVSFFPVSAACKTVVLIAFSAPCGAMCCMIPQLFGGDSRYGAGLVSISTLLSLVTMPIMLMLGLVLF